MEHHRPGFQVVGVFDGLQGALDGFQAFFAPGVRQGEEIAAAAGRQKLQRQRKEIVDADHTKAAALQGGTDAMVDRRGQAVVQLDTGNR